jgi:hypothetical protein
MKRLADLGWLVKVGLDDWYVVGRTDRAAVIPAVKQNLRAGHSKRPIEIVRPLEPEELIGHRLKPRQVKSYVIRSKTP